MLSGNWNLYDLQSWNIHEVLTIGRQERVVAFHGLGCEPEVLNSEIRAAPEPGELRGNDAECFACFGSHPKQRFAAQALEGRHRTLLFLDVSHQLNPETNLGDIDRGKIDRRLSGDRVDIRGADVSALNGNPQIRVDQESHGLRNSLRVPRLVRLLDRIAAASASAV